MESLENGEILEFRPDTLQYVRKLYGLDAPGRMKQSIDILEHWIKKQAHFNNKKFNRHSLEYKLLLCKGSMEKTKQLLDKSCTAKTLMPDYFQNVDVRSYFKSLYQSTKVVTLPKLTKDHYRTTVVYFKNNNILTDNLKKYVQLNIIFAEYLHAHDCNDGFHIVFDVRDINLLDVFSKAPVSDLRDGQALFTEGYGTRSKGIHIITNSSTIDTAMTILKSMLIKKLAERIKVHKTIDTLGDYIEKEVLPVDYGGTEKPLDELFEKWLDVVSTPEHMEYMKVVNSSTTDEKLRAGEQFQEKYMGLPGTFRSLNVD